MRHQVRRLFRRMGIDVRRVDPTLDFSLVKSGNLNIPYTQVCMDSAYYFIPEYARHRPAAEALLAGCLYEPVTHDLFARLCKIFPGSMVHAGTFFGDMVPNFSRFTSETLYAFEPIFENYALCRITVETNGLKNVVLFNAALSEKFGQGHMTTHESNNGKHLGGASHLSDSGQCVATMTIDSLNDPNISLIHLDVEGHELPALYGARETIATGGPILALEDMSRNCAPYLSTLDYVNVGQIPGLDIWSPRDKQGQIRQALDTLKQ